VTRPAYFCGLDLGQSHDFTALAVVERPAPDGGKAAQRPPVYAVRHLERFELGTSYVAVARAVARRLEAEALKGCTLAIDATGVGRAVYDIFKEARLPARLHGVQITAGSAIGVGDGGFVHIAKLQLASVVQRLLQTRRLKIAEGLAEAPTLVRELDTFQVKVSPSLNETFSSWRERDHDDLVLSLAIAAFFAEECHTTQYPEVVHIPSRIPERCPFGRARGRRRGPGDRHLV
jgi:hypothetical protein